MQDALFSENSRETENECDDQHQPRPFFFENGFERIKQSAVFRIDIEDITPDAGCDDAGQSLCVRDFPQKQVSGSDHENRGEGEIRQG